MNKQMDSRMFRAAAVLLCAGGLMVSSAMAQQPQGAPAPPDGQMQGPPQGGHEGRNPEHRLEILQKRLNLTDDQTAQIKSIWETQRTKAEAVRTNTALAPTDRRTQMMAIHEDSEAKVHAILTPEQKTKYDAMEARMREHGREGHWGATPNDGTAPPPPPAPQQ